MTGHVAENWRLLALSIGALADHIDGTIGIQLTPVHFIDLPPDPQAGMLACVDDSTVNTWGAAITSATTGRTKSPSVVLAFYNGIEWTVAGK